MPRKKTVKSKTISKPFSNIQKLQKEFLKTPAKLSAQVNKDVTTLKQKENKLKTALNKIKAQLKTSEGKLKTFAKAKNTANGKKQFKLLKKGHSETLKTQGLIQKQLKDTSKSLEGAQGQHLKLSALRKHLSQFEKEWAKNAKKLKTKPATKAKRMKQKSKGLPFKEKEDQRESFETVKENITIDEPTELTS